jgi:teichoic acid transport system ATP-binding protein
MSNTVICFNHVSKEYKLYKSSKHRLRGVFIKKTKYKIKKAVNDVSFSIGKGESVAIFGRNGAGKSTILKMITEVSYPTSGDISVKGRVSALLELTSGFDPEFTGRENIYLKGSILGLTQREIAEIEHEIIEFSEIEEYIDQPVRTYSSGMKARLGFSINVNIRPEILIIDEALSVGDESFKNKCVEKVNNIIEKDDVTLLFVTHSINVAKSFCKRGIVMKNGRIIYDGPIDDAINEYSMSIR